MHLQNMVLYYLSSKQYNIYIFFEKPTYLQNIRLQQLMHKFQAEP